jgi:3-hexulose-6-phosphate synthase
MRLQVAIDRISVESAENVIAATSGRADIIEVGTSLIKDFGLAGSVGTLKKKFPEQCILADIKTCDEGAYEFQKAYENGCDIATVMGFSSLTTIKSCAQVAGQFGKEYMIDLLEVPKDRLESLKKEFPEAIFCLHLPADKEGDGLEEMVRDMCESMGGVKKLAVAGGVKLNNISLMAAHNIDIVIVGSAITKSEDIKKETELFSEEIKRY